MGSIFVIILYFTVPILIMYLELNFSFVKKIGGVLLAYIVGIIIGTTSLPMLIGEDAQELISTIAIAFALPLLLFSMNIKAWAKQIKTTMLSLLTGVLSLLIVVIVGFFAFRNVIPELWKIAGMLVGVYTGGTPNLASIKIALDVDSDVYILAHTYDMIVSAVFILFVMSIGKQLLLMFLPAYNFKQASKTLEEAQKDKETNKKHQKLNKSVILPLMFAFILSIVVVAIGGGLSFLVPESMTMAVSILGITTFAIIASLFKQVNQIRYTFDFGMYFIFVFSIVVASMADFSNFSIKHLNLLIYITMGVFGSFIIHVLLAKIFKIDTDNVIIVSTALTCSPPFVPMVAGAIKNREIIISGITVGIIGYAIGNYLGISVAYILKYFFY